MVKIGTLIWPMDQPHPFSFPNARFKKYRLSWASAPELKSPPSLRGMQTYLLLSDYTAVPDICHGWEIVFKGSLDVKNIIVNGPGCYYNYNEII